MPKKAKVGKQRKDKFYQLAKETGYRSRSAFKLIQLNRKFEFLQKSRVLVDLCAAPGGWMQVAIQNMPVSSIVVGVDLFPIKSISGCISLQEDITTPRCLQLLKKELKTWKADVVLHDGAPNIGQNWLHDAYSQTALALNAFKLATNLLAPNGYFVTKVFRSKDYNALLWVLQQFFKNVYSTKPAASRIESAEIFVVCKGYLAPNHIDPKFLDPKYVFEEIELPEKKKIQQLFLEIGKKKKAEGYGDGDIIYKPINASEFISSPDYIDLLSNTSELKLDEDWIINNSLTTDEIKEFCKDVKVIGKKEIRVLVQWRKGLREKLDQFKKLKLGITDEDDENNKVAIVEDNEEDDDPLANLDEAIASMKEQESKEEKRKKKKFLKEQRKIKEKTNLDMIIPDGDSGPTDTMEDSLFSLKNLRTKKDLITLTEESKLPEIENEELDSEEELKVYEAKQKAKYVKYDKKDEVLDQSGRYYKKASELDKELDEIESDDDDQDPDIEKGLGLENDENDDEDNEDKLSDDFEMDEIAPTSKNPLITDLDPSNKTLKRLKKAQMWFDKEIFEDFDEESDEDADLDNLAKKYLKSGAQVLGFDKEEKEEDLVKKSNIKGSPEAKTKKRSSPADENAISDDDEDVKEDLTKLVKPSVSKKKKIKLEPEELALGTLMVNSRKTKRDILDDGWNRYAFGDKGNDLPLWFVDDEKRHMRKDLPVPDTLVQDYKNNLREINDRPIKKVVEAKARKKKRALKKMERAKKKSEAILEKPDMSDKEKANQIRALYKKAKFVKKKEVAYVVAKKFNTSKRMKRPAGVKGPYKVVDPRMKKDLRAMKSNSGGKKGKGGKGGGSGGKSKGKGGKGGVGKGKGKGRPGKKR